MSFNHELMRSARLVNEAEGLIARYPRLEAAEVDRLVNIYPRLSNVAVALMISDGDLGPRLESFARAERRRLRMPPRHLLGLLSPLLFFVAIIGWIVFA